MRDVTVQGLGMTPEQKLARALEEMLPYAESRLEDMSEDARTTNPEHRAEARRLYANALLKYRRARKALHAHWDAGFDSSRAVAAMLDLKPKTCDTCEAEGCDWRDDDYNTDGDCLAEK